MNIYKKLRKERGLTQTELSKILHVAQTTICKWENEKTIPDQTMLLRLSSFFNVPVDTLLKNTESIIKFANPQPEPNLSDNKKQLIEMVKELSEDDVMIAMGVMARLNNKPIEDIFKKIN